MTARLYEAEIEPGESGPGWPACPAATRPGDFLAGLLAGHAEDLGEPCTRHLGGKVRELRFHLPRRADQGHLLAGTGPAG